MKFMLMIISNEQAFGLLSEAQIGQVMQKFGEFDTQVRAANQFVDAHRLESRSQASTVRTGENGARVVSDGPFAETKEALGGYYVVDCPSKKEAIEWAKKIPTVQWGAVEVRPVMS